MKLLTVIDAGQVRPLAELERAILEMAIEACEGNYTRAAAALGIGRSTLFRKLGAKRDAPQAPAQPQPKGKPWITGRERYAR